MVTLGDNLSSSGDISSERLSTVSTVPTGGSKDVHSFSEDSHSIKGSGPISPETGDANDGTSMGEIVEGRWRLLSSLDSILNSSGWEYRNE